jgi:hypothetical protein
MQGQNHTEEGTPSTRISKYIAGLGGWRGKTLERLRGLILEAAPGLTEEWKWETPVFSLNGQVCALAAFKDHVKVNFFKGALLPDPGRLFNAGVDAKTSRALDFGEHDEIDEAGLMQLIRSAVELNMKAGKKA